MIPRAAITFDYLGCEYMSGDVANIERIAGSRPVIYLYEDTLLRYIELNGVPFGPFEIMQHRESLFRLHASMIRQGNKEYSAVLSVSLGLLHAYASYLNGASDEEKIPDRLR